VPEIATALAVGAAGVLENGIALAVEDGVLVPFAFTPETLNA
jgi:hypothetical protein